MAERATDLMIWVVDDDPDMRDSLEHLLRSAGLAVRLFLRAADIPPALGRDRPDAILSDLRMPGMTGLDLLKVVAEEDLAPPVILISAHGDIPLAVEAMQAGAYSFVEKPYDPQRLVRILRHAGDAQRLVAENRRLQDRLGTLAGLDRVLLGDTPVMVALRETVLDYADTGEPVLLLGETGTGKDLIARALHDLGRAASGPFVPVNCAAVPMDGFEAAMFGTGGGEAGYFQAAEGGTLFLDELAACDPAGQAKLLRALESGEIAPVGAAPREVRTRVVAATNEDLDTAVREGRFREDLYYRLAALTLHLPPLRDRREDVPLLFTHFLKEQSQVFECVEPDMTTEDLTALLAHDWPGNVRELRHVAARRVLAARRGRGSVAEALRLDDPGPDAPQNLRMAVAALERQLIRQAVQAFGGRMDPAAEALGIGRRTLNEKMVKLGISRDEVTE